MKLKKSETNNAIVTTLANVREHPNADRLKLATVLGTQVIVGLEAEDGDLVVYFDSNLRLSQKYLYRNNLYTDTELNEDSRQKGYFGRRGRVRAQRFRGEVSNGFVADLSTIDILFVDNFGKIGQTVYPSSKLKVGDEFTHIDEVEICSKYFVEKSGGVQCGTGKKKRKSRVSTNMFWKHWDTKQLMRETDRIVPGTLYVEEKIHGTSGRTAHALYHRRRRWFQFWKPRVTSFWKVVSGTRRVDGVKGHMKSERRDIHEKLAPHVHKGEELYYEIYGYQYSGKVVQSVGGHQFVYDCVYLSPIELVYSAVVSEKKDVLPYKVVLYRVTITTEDGYRIDLDREQVYRRAEELGLEKPVLLDTFLETEHTKWDDPVEVIKNRCSMIIELAKGNSALDSNTMREGIVVWFKDRAGNWTCLKHKSEEFLMLDSRNKDSGFVDPEDNL